MLDFVTPGQPRTLNVLVPQVNFDSLFITHFTVYDRRRLEKKSYMNHKAENRQVADAARKVIL